MNSPHAVPIQVDQSLLARLSYAKLLLGRGLATIQQKEVGASGIGILSLQDSVEMTFRAALEAAKSNDVKD